MWSRPWDTTPVSYTHLDVYKRQSVLTGALVKGKTLHEAVRLAEAFVRECAIQTIRCV